MVLLQQLNKEQEATMMLVTHDPMAASYCNRVVFIKDGKLYNELYCGEKPTNVLSENHGCTCFTRREQA